MTQVFFSLLMRGTSKFSTEPPGKHVDFSGFESDRPCCSVGNDLPVDPVDVGLALLVIVWVLHQLDVSALLPFLEHEGAGTDRRIVSGVSLEVGAFINVLWEHRHRADFEDTNERTEGLLQRENDSVIVGRLDFLDLRQVAARARMESA